MDRKIEYREIPGSELGISLEQISHGARTVVEQLNDAGYEACLVGGCVRDLVSGRQPKDFDVATSALPNEIKQVFPRARLIGRRFRLAHVRIGREIVEVSTFRADPDNDDNGGTDERGRILRDNQYGSRDEDALRRDFTMNSLYYNCETDTVYDYHQGYEDLQAGALRVVGDPETRFSEDPVRMLRAVRFMAALDVKLEKAAEDSLHANAPLIGYVPPARLFDEVLKMFHNGSASIAFDMLHDYGLFEFLFPVTHAHGEPPDGDGEYALIRKALSNTDTRVREGKPVIAAFLFASFLWDAVRTTSGDAIEDGKNPLEALRDAANMAIREQIDRVAIPRRVSAIVTEIWEMQKPLELRRQKSVERLLSSPRFRAAYDFLLLRESVGEVKEEVCQWWTNIQNASESDRNGMVRKLSPGPSRRKQRRRRPRRKPLANPA